MKWIQLKFSGPLNGCVCVCVCIHIVKVKCCKLSWAINVTNFCRSDAFPDAQPTVSKHWRQLLLFKNKRTNLPDKNILFSLVHPWCKGCTYYTTQTETWCQKTTHRCTNNLIEVWLQKCIAIAEPISNLSVQFTELQLSTEVNFSSAN